MNRIRIHKSEQMSCKPEKAFADETNSKYAPLTEDEKKYLPYAWRLLGGDDMGSLPARQLGKVMRGFGKNPSEQDIQYLKYEHEVDDDRRLIYNEFVKLYRACAPGTDSKERLEDAFRVFDKENEGKIKAEDLRYKFNSSTDKKSQK
ncbi:uncharacterized protein LOC127873155 [Dreissena polymorpha]|uniref:uncharacterized protein LOC127873155 n=1 Tax=Dreissena polymorpha TaxID=45954 RepID=UPI00226542A5|nr:uncharacterized protein LOC127873155 [Dreissena polymorpha]